MLRDIVLLALIALSVASPLWPFNSDATLNDWPPQPGCHYNISAAHNFSPNTSSSTWYFDSVTSPNNINSLTCLRIAGSIHVNQAHVGTVNFHIKVASAGGHLFTNCTGPNYADAVNDFSTVCRTTGSPTPFKIQMRIAETDAVNYALVTFCVTQPGHTPSNEAMGMLAANKNGLKPAVRKRLTQRLVKAGWLPDLIKRVPTQNGC